MSDYRAIPAAVTGGPVLAAVACLTGIAAWKRARMRAFFPPDTPIRHGAATAVAVARRRGGAVAGWASRLPYGLAERAAAAGVPLYRIEDGFIRSRGLGAALTPPASIVIDTRGMYYDPATPSDLEILLQSTPFTDGERTRAERLIAALRTGKITKYNLAGSAVDLPPGRRIVLVPGQVPGDRSMLLGAAGVGSTLALLERVRALEPASHILYKPHPDVVAGLRHGALDPRAALRFVDRVIEQADLVELLERVDAVHVATSLTGLEALIRGREVVTHGQPFYAGWGLTRDLRPVARRTRRLSLAEFVAGALIAYPRYVDPLTGASCAVEQTVARLAEQRPQPRQSAWNGLAVRAAAFYARRHDVI